MFFILIPNVYSLLAPPPLYEQPLILTVIVLFSSNINIIIEFGVVYTFLRSIVLIKKELFDLVALVNLVIFTPFYAFSFFIVIFLIEFYVYYAIIVIIIIVLIELLLYRIGFRRLFYRKSISKVLSLRKTALISIFGNIVSFSIFFLYPIILMILFGAP